MVSSQQWHAGDTINTDQKDTARIDMFRDNTMNYTGQAQFLLDDK